MKWKRHVIPIYDIEVFFCIEKDSAKVEQKIRSLQLDVDKRDLQDLRGDSAGLCFPLFQSGERVSYLLRVPSFHGSVIGWGAVSHEIIHLKNYVWEHIGLDRFPTEYDEVEAYLIGHITEEFLKFARRRTGDDYA